MIIFTYEEEIVNKYQTFNAFFFNLVWWTFFYQFYKSPDTYAFYLLLQIFCAFTQY